MFDPAEEDMRYQGPSQGDPGDSRSALSPPPVKAGVFPSRGKQRAENPRSKTGTGLKIARIGADNQ